MSFRLKTALLAIVLSTLSQVAFGDWKSQYQLQRPTDQLQERIDEAYLKIFRTQWGQWLCGFFSGTKTIAKVTGSSPNAANQVALECRPQLKSKLGPAGDVMAQWQPAQIFFVFTGQKDFPLRSWSDRGNNVYLFYEKQSEVTEDSLIGRLSHELAIRLDLVDFFRGYQVITDFEASTLKAFFKIHYPSSNSCQSLHLFENKLLRLYFNSARASAFEDKIYSQVYGRQIHQREQPGTCLSRLISGLPNFSEIPAEFVNESSPALDTSLLLETKIRQLGCQQFNEQTLLDDLIFLAQEKIQKETTTIGLCDYFETPMLGLSPDILSDGPAPRIGGGWKSAEPRGEVHLLKDFKIDPTWGSNETDSNVQRELLRRKQELIRSQEPSMDIKRKGKDGLQQFGSGRTN